MPVSTNDRRKVLYLKSIAVEHFDSSNWIELGTVVGQFELVDRHPRLLRSLSFGDDDYDGCALQVLMRMVETDQDCLSEIEHYITTKFGGGGQSVSSAENAGPRIYFQPNVFSVPSEAIDRKLISAMMPFSPSFAGVWTSIQDAALYCGMKCQRADNIWQESTVIQDIFGLIYRSQIVVCDFSGKNPNVFYEAGIAHTLGKHVIPITQSHDDIPFDLRHHRYLSYLNNGEGLSNLTTQLSERIRYLASAGGPSD